MAGSPASSSPARTSLPHLGRRPRARPRPRTAPRRRRRSLWARPRPPSPASAAATGSASSCARRRACPCSRRSAPGPRRCRCRRRSAHRRRRSPELLLTPELHEEVRVNDLAGCYEIRDRVDGAGYFYEVKPERCAIVESDVDGGARRCLRDGVDGGHQVVQEARRAPIDKACDCDPIVAPEVRDHVRAARLGRKTNVSMPPPPTKVFSPKPPTSTSRPWPAFSRLPSPPFT